MSRFVSRSRLVSSASLSLKSKSETPRRALFADRALLDEKERQGG